MKKILASGIIGLFLFSLVIIGTSCSGDFAGDSETTAAVTINLGDDVTGRMAYGPTSGGAFPRYNDLEFKVFFEPTPGSRGTAKTITRTGPSTGVINDTVIPGEYEVEIVISLRADGSTYAEGGLVDSSGNQLNSVILRPGRNNIRMRVEINPLVRGDGSSPDPFKIYDDVTLQRIGQGPNPSEWEGDWALNAHYIMIRDIPLPATNWPPIGTADIAGFTGVFDGNGHFISGLTISSVTGSNIGLFARNSGTIRNLGLLDVDIDLTNATVGAIVGGIINQGRVENCFVTGTVTGGQNTGGIAGNINQGTIENCYFAGTVTGTTTIGGIAGNLLSGEVRNCYSTGTVSGSSSVGGIAGQNAGRVENCYSTSTLSGTGSVGGIVGFNAAGLNTIVKNSVALNGSIINTHTDDLTNNFGRVSGTTNGVFDGNHARGDMVLYINFTGAPGVFPNFDDNGKDGADVGTWDPDWFVNTAGFADPWWEGKLPTGP